MAKFNVAKARAAGATDEQIKQVLAQRPDLQVVDEAQQQPQQGGGITDWLPTAGSVIGGIAGAPIAGPVGAIGGSALGGAGGEWLRQLITGQQTDVGSIAKEGALGGVGGVAGAVAGPLLKGARALVSGGAKAAATAGVDAAANTAARTATKTAATAATEGGDNLLTRLGESLRKGVIKPKVSPSAGAFGKEKEMVQAAKNLGLFGPAEMQRSQSSILQKEIYGEIQNKLATNNPVLDPNATKSAVKQSIQGMLNYDTKSPAWKTAMKLRVGQVGDLKNVQELVKYKQELGGRLDRVFRKIDMGIDLTTQEEAGLATWQSIDRVISTVAPELKEQTLKLSMLEKLAPGLQISAQKGVNLPIIGNSIPGASYAIQGATDTAGRALEAVGSSQLPGQVAKVAGAAATQEGTRAVLDPQQTDASQVTESPTSGSSIGSGTNGPLSDFSGEPMDKSAKIKQAFIAAMLSNPKQADQLKKIYDFGFGSNDKPLTAQQQKDQKNANSGLRAISTVKDELKKDSNAPLKSKIPFLSAQSPYRAAAREVADVYTRLRTGAALSESEIKFYDEQMPQPFDSPDVIKYKLKQFENLFNDVAFRTKGSGGDLADFSALGGGNSTVDQFAQ